MLRSVSAWFYHHAVYLLVVLAFFFSLVRIQQLSDARHEDCHARQIRYEALRTLIVDMVQDYPPARREFILNEMNTGLPPVNC